MDMSFSKIWLNLSYKYTIARARIMNTLGCRGFAKL